MLSNALAVHTRRWAEAYAERGHQVELLSIRDCPIPGVRVHQVSLGPKNASSRAWTALSYLRLGLELRGRLRRMRPDVLQACFATTHGAMAAISGWHPRALSVWGSDVVGAAERPWLFRTWTRRAVAGADRVYATGSFLAAEVRRLHAVPVILTPFGVDVDRFRPPSEPRLRRPGDRLVIGFVKTLAPHYGPEVLLEAVAHLARTVPELRLLMYGRDRMEGRLQRQAAELGIADRVELRGFVDHDELPGRLLELDVLVNPSLCRESFGVSILEASACGLPVVASDIGGIPEVCQADRTGILVPPGDPLALSAALEDLAANPARGRALGEAGRRFVAETYRWDECVTRMLKELGELAAR